MLKKKGGTMPDYSEFTQLEAEKIYTDRNGKFFYAQDDLHNLSGEEGVVELRPGLWGVQLPESAAVVIRRAIESSLDYKV